MWIDAVLLILMYSMKVMMRFFPILLLGCSDYKVSGQSSIETFFQNERLEGIDILWVIDDSATMYEENDLLMASAGEFISFVSNSSVDFQIGVVSTDMDENPGILRGPVLDVETSEMEDRFVEQIGSDRVGSRDERGFEAALIAADPNVNMDFARARSDLEMVIFSDEDDHSDVEAATFLSQLQSQRPDSSVKIHAVVGDPPAGCVSVLAAADVGARYLEAQEASGGRRESICTLDYGSMLARVALDVIGLDTVFVMTKVPSPPTIELLVDGVEVQRRDVDGWRYNPGDNSIVFDGFAVPRAGATINITYNEWAGPLEDLEEVAE